MPTNQQPELTLTHEFNAPKERVFNAFADADALNAWWGPVESKNTVIKLDFRTGGIFHFKMENRGNVSYGRFLFGHIQPYDLLEFTNGFADENANLVKAPFAIQLPLEIFYRLIFTENNGKTVITLTGKAVNASDDEQANFISINANVQQGFGATFNQLVTYLMTVQNR